MNKLFVFQLITSFIIGGGFIALLSLLAERVNSRLSGIIIMFPSTIALGLFFLGWATSPETVSTVAPATLIPLGLTTLFPIVYIRFAHYSERILNNKVWQVVLSFIGSAVVWLVFALPIAILHISSLVVGVAGYVLLVLLSNFLIHRPDVSKPRPLTYTLVQKIGRATFVGFIVTLILYLSKSINPFLGGIFAVFPAALSSMLILFHWYYGAKSLLPNVQKVAVGSISIAVYALTSMIAFPQFGFVLGTLFAYAVSLLVSLYLSKQS